MAFEELVGCFVLQHINPFNAESSNFDKNLVLVWFNFMAYQQL